MKLKTPTSFFLYDFFVAFVLRCVYCVRFSRSRRIRRRHKEHKAASELLFVKHGQRVGILSTGCSLLFLVLFISCKRSNSLFTNLSPSKTNITFTNTLEKQKAFGILYYLYY